VPAFVDSHFTVRNPAWHDLTGEYDHEDNPASLDELLQWSGTDWEPVRAPVFATKESHSCDSKTGCAQLAVALVNSKYYACGRHAIAAQKSKHEVAPLPQRQLPGFQTVQRSDNGEVINVANSSYEVYGNREAAELVELLLDSTVTSGGVKFETGGSLKGGRLIWYLARLNSPVEVKGDSSPIYPYLSVLNAHDGTAALRLLKHNIRIVCWNTWQAAEKEGVMFAFRHTQSIRDRIDDIRKAVLETQDQAETWAKYASEHLMVPIDDKQMDEFLELYVPMPPTGAISERVEANVRSTRGAIKKFYHSPSCASVAGTAYGVLQATTEYLDHGRAYRTPDTYLSRTMLKPEPAKAKALSLLQEVVGIGA
jgi:phage/plasmid-like protein (TIGR03299 family)